MEFKNIDRDKQIPLAVYEPVTRKRFTFGFGMRAVMSKLVGQTLKVPVTEEDAKVLESKDHEEAYAIHAKIIKPDEVIPGDYHVPEGSFIEGQIGRRAVAVRVNEVQELPRDL